MYKFFKILTFSAGMAIIFIFLFLFNLNFILKSEFINMERNIYNCLKLGKIKKKYSYIIPVDKIEYNEAILLEKADLKKESIKMYQKVIRKTKSNDLKFKSHVQISLIYLYINDLFNAYKNIKEALRINPKSLYAKKILEIIFLEAKKQGKGKILQGEKTKSMLEDKTKGNAGHKPSAIKPPSTGDI